MSRVEGLVTGHVDLGEADRVLRLLTDAGRLDVVARHVRASKKRFAGALETGSRVRVELSSRRGLPVITSAERLSGPRKAREDLWRLAMLCYGLEVTARLAPEHAPAKKLYRLAVVWGEMCESDAAPRGASRLAMEAKALTFAGLAPALVRCASCGEALEAPVVFSLEGGGANHSRCGAGHATTVRWLAALEGLRRTPLADTLGGPPVPSELGWMLSDFVAWQLGAPLKTRALLEGLG